MILLVRKSSTRWVSHFRLHQHTVVVGFSEPHERELFLLAAFLEHVGLEVLREQFVLGRGHFQQVGEILVELGEP